MTEAAPAVAMRDTQAFLDAFRAIVNEGSRTLASADAQAGERRRWWHGQVRCDRRGLEVGFVFDLRTEPAPMGKHLRRYRLVAMAVAPEGYYAVTGYEDNWQPPTGRPVPVVALTDLVRCPGRG